MGEEQNLPEDDRAQIEREFEHTGLTDSSGLGSAFAATQRGGVETVGDQFAHPEILDGRELGKSFADPNSMDDARLGDAFAAANTHARKHRDQPTAKRPQGSRKVLYWIVAGALVLFLLIFLIGVLPRYSRNKRNTKLATEQQDHIPVIEVQRVQRSKSAAGLVIPGTTTPFTEAYVFARANGYLRKRYVDIGDRVRRGQVLALIDSPDLDQQVDQARQQLRQAEAQKAQQDTQLALTRITVERWRVLVAKGVFSRQDGDQREADYQAQIANVAAAQRNVEAFRANLNRVIALQSYERVTSPFDGVITSRNVDVGALISAQGTAGGMGSLTPTAQTGGTASTSTANSSGSTGTSPTAASPTGSGGGNGGALFSVAQIDRLRILVSVPEGYATSVKTGQKATVHFQEFPHSAFSGSISRTAAAIDQNTRTLLTEVDVANADRKLLTGMYAVVTFDAIAGDGPLLVSGDAIAVRGDRNVVALVRDNTIHIEPVDIGRDFGPVVEILTGLKEGDLVASSFTDDVKEGVKITPKQSEVAGEAASPKAPPSQKTPPGGSTQYGNQSITDANMQGQIGKQKSEGAGKPGGAKNSGSGGKQ